jgi:GTPase SAR1 family protein
MRKTLNRLIIAALLLFGSQAPLPAQTPSPSATASPPSTQSSSVPTSSPSIATSASPVPAPSSASASPVPAPSNSTRSSWDDLWDWPLDLKKVKDSIRDRATELVLLLVSLVFAASTAWLKVRFDQLKAKVGVLSSRIFDPVYARPTHFDQYATNLILIGEGGSGKTTVLHALSGADEARPDVATAEVSTYTLVHETSIEVNRQITRRLVRVYADDYVGQNWVQGTQSELVKARQAIVLSSTLVIVVDVVDEGSKLVPSQRHDKPQVSRVREHLKAYNEGAIQTLIALMGKRSQLVLFINKVDLIYPLTDQARSAILQAFHPLIERLEEIRGVELHIILGSAATGMGITGYDFGNKGNKSLYKFVVDHADEIDPYLLKKTKHG